MVICVVIVVRIYTPGAFIVYSLITFIFNIVGTLIILKSYVSYKGMDIIRSHSCMTWDRSCHRGRVIVLIICVIICLRARFGIIDQVFVVVLICIRKIMSIIITQNNPGGVAVSQYLESINHFLGKGKGGQVLAIQAAPSKEINKK